MKRTGNNTMSNRTNNKRVWALTAAASLAVTGAARGQSTGPSAGPSTAPAGERFVADGTATGGGGGGTLTLNPRAVVAGADVRLRDVCRWSDADAATFAPLAELTVVRLGDGGSTGRLAADGLRATLRAAGVNLAGVRLTGAASCTVSRDITVTPAAVPAAVSAAVSAALSAAAPMSKAEAECSAFHTLRERLTADAADRLGVPAADLQVTFASTDANLLNLSEPAFHFQLDPKRVKDLGRVSWDVVVMNGSATQRATVSADARAWQNQLVLTAAMAYHGVIRATDVAERRVLVDHLGEDAVLTKAQAVGQQAARELKPGAVLTGRLVDPVPLAHVGQYVTVTLQHGGVQVRTVAKAMEGGTYGQTIKVKNESTRDEFQVVLTGPQMATLGPPAGDANLASVPGD